MKKILIIGLLILSACAKENSSSNTPAPESCGIKPLFSDWTEMTKVDPFRLLLTGFKFGDNDMILYSNNEPICKFNFNIQGTECSGVYNINNVQQIASIDTIDCIAEIKESNGIYKKTNDGLRLDNQVTGLSVSYEKGR